MSVNTVFDPMEKNDPKNLSNRGISVTAKIDKSFGANDQSLMSVSKVKSKGGLALNTKVIVNNCIREILSELGTLFEAIGINITVSSAIRTPKTGIPR